MAKNEAFCTKCGSLINIDDSKEKNKCLFCGSEVATKNALELKNNTEARLALQKEAESKAKEDAATKKQLQKQIKTDKPDTAASSAAVTKEIVVLKPMPLKMKLILFGSLIGMLVILAGVFIPTILSRNQKRSLMTTQLDQKIEFSIKSQAFKFNDNRELYLATDSSVAENLAKSTYQTYMQIYTEAYHTTAAKAENKLVVRLYAKNGLYVCENIQGTLFVDFETSTPTPTTVPTVVIKEP
ncbi:MAG: hypothetical protein ACYCYI_00985 [Saccharofermentanales bacterium]